MQKEINFVSPNVLLTRKSGGAQGDIVVTLGGLFRFALFFIICLLISILITGISIMATGWVLGDFGLA